MIGNYAGAILLVAGFSILFLRLQLIERSGRINGIVRHSAAVAADRSLGDDAKARAMRRNSLSLFGLFADLIFRLALTIGLPLLLVWGLSFTQAWSFQGAIDATFSWPVLIVGLLPVLAIFLRFGCPREG